MSIENLPKKEKASEIFYKKIEDLIQSGNEGIPGSFYFSSILNVRDLTKEDEIIWDRVKDNKSNPITNEELENYRKEVSKDGNKSRIGFGYYITNLLTLYQPKKHKEKLKN